MSSFLCRVNTLNIYSKGIVMHIFISVPKGMFLIRVCLSLFVGPQGCFYAVAFILECIWFDSYSLK